MNSASVPTTAPDEEDAPRVVEFVAVRIPFCIAHMDCINRRLAAAAEGRR